MTDKQKAIEWFSMLKEKFVKTEYEGYLDMAISALEKQESKKPLKMKDCKLRFPYSCPECYTEIPPGCEYCWRCGKKIDWSKEEA